MARSVLNVQQSRLTNRSLYFVLGLLSLAKSLEDTLDQPVVDNLRVSADTAGDEAQDFLYFTLGALSLSRQLQNRLGIEWELAAADKNAATHDTTHTPSNLMD